MLAITLPGAVMVAPIIVVALIGVAVAVLYHRGYFDRPDDDVSWSAPTVDARWAQWIWAYEPDPLGIIGQTADAMDWPWPACDWAPSTVGFYGVDPVPRSEVEEAARLLKAIQWDREYVNRRRTT